MLFDPLSAALGAATGELVFSEIMLGQFGGLGEIEKFVTVTLGVYIAGRLVRNPKNQKMVGIAAMIGTGAQLFMGMMVDILKVQFAIEILKRLLDFQNQYSLQKVLHFLMICYFQEFFSAYCQHCS